VSDTKTVKVQGVSTLGMLGVLFVALKLTGHVDWSWPWVTAPFWGGLGIVAVILVGFVAFAAVAMLGAAIVDAWRAMRRKAVRR
jgi:hypothetical protein